MSLPTFEERFEYLALAGRVGERTFGGDRYFNQEFYRSAEWRRVRNEVIARDLSCDLGMAGRVIFSRPLVHHIVPVTIDDIHEASRLLLDPDNLITVSHGTHNAIHYGDASLVLPSEPLARKPNDTCPWRG